MAISSLSIDELTELRIHLANAADGVEQLLYDLRFGEPLSTDLERLASELGDFFGEAADFVVERVRCRGGLAGLAVFVKGMIDRDLLVRGGLDRLADAPYRPGDAAAPEFLQGLSQTTTILGTPEPVRTFGELAGQVLAGCVVLAFEGCAEALSLKVDELTQRGVGQPTSEPAVVGPQDAFIESSDTNISLVRRRLRTPRLRIDQMRIGTISRTAVYVLHLHGVADDLLVREVARRLKRIQVDGVLDSQQVAELIRDAPLSPFPTLLRTERPDRTTAALLEGQVAVIVDGSPQALVMPVTFARLMKSASDYYQPWAVGTAIRLLRLGALLMGLFLPALYVAITGFHQEFVPTSLLITLAAAHENVPLPTFFEVLLMLLLFEVIREAGVRVPQGVGSAVTIGGTLVVGQAAVRAGLISSPVVVVAAGVVIAFFVIPNYETVQVTRMIMYPLVIAASILGFYGLLFVAGAFILHLASLRSFGTPYLDPVAPMVPRNWKDFVLRAPRWKMDTRPLTTAGPNPVRQAPDQKPDPPDPIP